MPNIDTIEEKKIIRSIKGWMIDDYATSDILAQLAQTWSLDEAKANKFLIKAKAEWKQDETENNEQRRLRKIDSLKKLKRSLKDTYKGTPAGINSILSIETKLIELEMSGKSASSKPANEIEIHLTGKQEKFCREYIIDFNATQAYKRAGYAANTDLIAGVEGHKLLKNPKIWKFIDLLREDIRKKAEISTDIVVQELREIAEGNIQDFLSGNNSIRDLTTLPRKLTKAVAGIKVTEKILPDGSRQVTQELKLVDRKSAWVDLGRHTGAFKEDNLQKAIPAQLSDSQFEQLLTAARETKTHSS